MKRTKGTAPTVQPGLFDSADVYGLAEKNLKLEQQNARLKKELAQKEKTYQRLIDERNQLLAVKLGDETHPLCREKKRLKHEVDHLRQILRQELMGTLHGRNGSLGKDALTKLGALCHPDKWSHPDASALVLTHEVTVMVNKWRDRVGGA